MKAVVPHITVSILLALLAAAARPLPAGAHAVLVSSSPKNNAVLSTPPKKVSLHFDARIEKRVAEVTLLDSRGRRVPLPSAKNGYTSGPSDTLIIPMPSLKPGRYQLRYKILATDGHITPGLIGFTVAEKKPK